MSSRSLRRGRTGVHMLSNYKATIIPNTMLVTETPSLASPGV